MGSRRVPQGRRLAHSEYAAASEQTGTGRVQRHVGDRDGPDLAHLEPRAPGGMVVVAVRCGHGVQQAARPLRRSSRGQDGGHLDIGVEGYAFDLLFDQEWVVDAGPPLP